MNLPEISENLIEQLNHGNTKAFDKIYHTYYLYLCAIAVYYVHDRRVAGEIVNDVFVAVCCSSIFVKSIKLISTVE